MGQDRQAQESPAAGDDAAAQRSGRPALKPELQVLAPAVRSVLALALALVVAALILFALAELRGVLVTLMAACSPLESFTSTEWMSVSSP